MNKNENENEAFNWLKSSGGPSPIYPFCTLRSDIANFYRKVPTCAALVTFLLHGNFSSEEAIAKMMTQSDQTLISQA
jgi:hypothetical protein